MLSPLNSRFAQPERKLAVGVARRVPDFQLQAADRDHVAFVDQRVELHRRHFQVDVLRLDFGERFEPVALGQRLGRLGMPADRGLQSLFDFGQALNVIDVGVRGDQRFAIRQREIELADQIDDFVDRFLKADVDQHPLVLVEHQIDIAAQPLPGLVVHFDDMGKNWLALEHGKMACAKCLMCYGWVHRRRILRCRLRHRQANGQMSLC